MWIWLIVVVLIIALVMYYQALPAATIVETSGFRHRVLSQGEKKSAQLMERMNDLAIEVIKAFRREIEVMKTTYYPPPMRALIKDIYKQLNTNYNPDGLNEAITAPFNPYTTSYTARKGEEVCMCLRNKDGFHEWPVIAMVFLHELAHVASTSWSLDSHNKEFWKKYAMILAVVDKYHLVDTRKLPTKTINYCDRIRIKPGEFSLLQSSIQQ